MSVDTLTAIRDVFADKLGVDPAVVVLEAELAGDLGADSLDAIEVIMALEELYGIEFDGEQVENLKTVADVVELVDTLTA
ncbi:MAG: acyl carrier protein [Coriobacteriales bacterium]|jgi:acyl carrier protein|nr:acyl carrier protein [Coriobacteriales bacterium]